MNLDSSRSRLEAFEQCGAKAFVYAATVGGEEYCVRGSNCHDRFCQPCASARSWAIKEKLRPLTADKPLLFITLTLRHHAGEKLRDQLNRLMSCFRQLRRCELWSKAIAGGVAVYEIKRTDKHRWHTHLHILGVGTWLDAQELSRLWRGITLDSFSVDVQRVTDAAGSVDEVAKYASKPMEAGFWRVPALLEECIEALKGRRLVTQFGDWYNAGGELDDEEGECLFDDDPRRWRLIGSPATLARAAAAGSAAARRVVECLRFRDPLDGSRPARPPPLLGDTDPDLASRDRLNRELFALMNEAPV